MKTTGTVLSTYGENCRALLTALQGAANDLGILDAEYIPTKLPAEITELETIQLPEESGGS